MAPFVQPLFVVRWRVILLGFLCDAVRRVLEGPCVAEGLAGDEESPQAKVCGEVFSADGKDACVAQGGHAAE